MRKIVLLMILTSLSIFLLTGCKPDDSNKPLDLSWVLLIVGSDDTYGLINQENDVIVPLEYDTLVRLGTHYLGEKDSTLYLFDKEGKQLFTLDNATVPDDIDDVSRRYLLDNIDLSTSSLIPFIRNDRYGFADMNGDVIIQPIYVLAESFMEEYGIIYAVKEDYTRGYIGIDNTEVIPFDNIKLGKPVEGMIQVGKQLSNIRIDYTYGFYNTDGELVIDIQYEEVRDFKGGYSVVEIDNDLGVIDTNGNLVLQAEYYSILIFPEIKRISTRTTNAESIVYDFSFNRIDEFPDNYPMYFFTTLGYSSFSYDGNVGLIDKDGNIVFETAGIIINRASTDGHYYVVIDDSNEERTYHLYNIDGDKIITQDQYIRNYSDGYLVSESDSNTYSLTSTNGDIVIADQDMIYSINGGGFGETLYTVINQGEHRIITQTGTPINNHTYSNSSLIWQLGLFSVAQNDKWGYIDSNGNEIIPLEYDYVEDGNNVVPMTE
ncbi:WG repeat-containing protein [Candidatus Xianfuyuplasma coldseepsis]|uniref:WG repeat-containing protein n=1 Tax=Candidatus Xianfuyuplasma coldseepsis TaxID=2782163 RepID=A0A7L7KUW1_9MOLU|nr:WG repeat-containing protein [Xianfuyuplasma coldseepsis]QMS85558.1 WG repeat-containing protein [Xianfuyuplasma coldseepsis]